MLLVGSLKCGLRKRLGVLRSRKFGLRLDYYAAPAAFIEPKGYIISNRMPCADIDVGPSRLSRERDRKMIVLEIL